MDRLCRFRYVQAWTTYLFIALFALIYTAAAGQVAAADAPVPLLAKGHPVEWWFVFKFNASSFPGCGGGANEELTCRFDTAAAHRTSGFSQQFVYASNEEHKLQKGSGCAGGTTTDPLGATFDQVFNGSYYYVIWNDQPYAHPKIDGCTSNGNCGSPWGHSKGMLAWNDAGDGLVLQVTTPSWPESGSKDHPRQGDANTLGCVADNNVKLSQHFFSVKLTKDDLVKVLRALQNSSVVTDPNQRQVVNNGGPAEVQQLVSSLGVKSQSKSLSREKLSTGVELISKPSHLNVPPWQMVSAVLGGVPLRAATFWASPYIPTTTRSTKIDCWDASLGKPGPVQIATTGQWATKEIGLIGGSNHAKIGVSTAGTNHYAIFGDENQQGALSGNCASSQNGRGGLFFVIDDEVLSEGIADLIDGETASTKIPTPGGKK
jgi:hypothetical protein